MKTQKKPERRWLAEEVLHHLAEAPRTGKALAAVLGIPGKKLYEITKTLKDRGLAEKNHEATWCLTSTGVLAAKEGWKIRGGRPGVARAPKRGGWTERDKAWTALRNRNGKGTLLDIAEDMDLRNARKMHNIGCYFGALEKSGHLSRSRAKDFSGPRTNPGRHVWLLINNSGPKAPLWRSAKGEVYDRNTKETTDISVHGDSHEDLGNHDSLVGKNAGKTGNSEACDLCTRNLSQGHPLVRRGRAGSKKGEGQYRHFGAPANDHCRP